MKLYYTDWSPFARKVLVAAIERGLEDEIELVPANIGFAEGTLKVKETELSSYNPSGRVPTLLTESGKTIFDSTVIVNYLDGIGIAPPIIPLDYKLRVAALRLNALVDEVIDAMRHLSFENYLNISCRNCVFCVLYILFVNFFISDLISNKYDDIVFVSKIESTISD